MKGKMHSSEEIIRVLRQDDGGVERGNGGNHRTRRGRPRCFAACRVRWSKVELANEVCPLAGIATAILRRFGE